MIYLLVFFNSVIQCGEGVGNTALFINVRIDKRHFGKQACVDGGHRSTNRNVPYEVLYRFQVKEVVKILVVDFFCAIRSDAQTTT